MSTKVDIPGTSYQRDISTKAILQTDKRAIDDYQMKRKLIDSRKQNDADINTLKEDVGSLKSEMNEIKELIKGLYK